MIDVVSGFVVAGVALVVWVAAVVILADFRPFRRRPTPDRSEHIRALEHDLDMHRIHPESDCDQCCWSAGRLAPPKADWQRR